MSATRTSATRASDLVGIITTLSGKTPNLHLHNVAPSVAKSIVEATLPEGVSWKAVAAVTSEWLDGSTEDGVKITLFLTTVRPAPVPALVGEGILKAAGA
jgi:hypothetical protein